MRRAIAFAVALILLAPVVQLVVACASSPCCQAEETTIQMAMPCCEPTMCADPAPAGQPQAASIERVVMIALHDVTPGVTVTLETPSFEVAPYATPPAPVRVRLAQLSTLLI